MIEVDREHAHAATGGARVAPDLARARTTEHQQRELTAAEVTDRDRAAMHRAGVGGERAARGRELRCAIERGHAVERARAAVSELGDEAAIARGQRVTDRALDRVDAGLRQRRGQAIAMARDAEAPVARIGARRLVEPGPQRGHELVGHRSHVAGRGRRVNRVE